MKTLYTLLILSIPFIGFGQNLNNLVANENPSFYEIQKAFNEYWEPYNVKNGKYIKDGELYKAYGWKQFKRWEWYWEPRVGPSGVFPKSTALWNAWEKLEVDNSSFNLYSWIPKGPNDENVHGLGRVNCIAFHPSDPDILWIGTPAGGIWKTNDGGTSWVPLADDLPVLGVSSIAVHPSDPDIIYIATGDGDMAESLQSFGNSMPGDTKSVGVLKTIDGGLNWSVVLSAELSEGILMRKLLIDPNNPSKIYVATSIGIWKTSDSGETWTSNNTDEYFIDMEFKPNDPSIIYASTYNYDGNTKFFRSNNSGDSFQEIEVFPSVNRINIEVSPANPDWVDLLCSSSENDGFGGYYYSVNSGVSFDLFIDPNICCSNYLGWKDTGDEDGSDGNGAGQGTYDLAFTIDPSNYNNIFIGGINTFMSTNGGVNWESSNMWTDGTEWNTFGNDQIVHADKHSLDFHPLVPNTLYECNDGGVYKSSDGGETWMNLSQGLQISQFYSISSSQISEENITGGRQDNGSLAIIGDQEVALTGGDGMITHIDYAEEEYIYTSYVNGEIYRIFNEELTTISENIPAGQNEGASPTGEWLTPYTIDPNTSTTLYAGYNHLYKSFDRGDSWVNISSSSPDLGGEDLIKYLTVSKSDPSYIYVGWDNTILKTNDGGFTWYNITGSLPVDNSSISSINVDPANELNLVVTFSGYNSDKVYITGNGGDTWIDLSNNLPEIPANCSAIDEMSGNVYIGTDLGVFYFDNISEAWLIYGENLPNVVVTDLDIQYSSELLRTGTFGRGLWEIPLLNSSEWNCVENSCVETLSGTGEYATLSACEGNCSSIFEPTFNCIFPLSLTSDNGYCEQMTDGSGEYETLLECEIECIVNLTWNCSENLACVEVNNETGEYDSLSVCEEECTSSFIKKPNKINKKLKKITNLLGQEIPIRKNTPMFYIYDDGTVEKKVIIE